MPGQQSNLKGKKFPSPGQVMYLLFIQTTWLFSVAQMKETSE
jgi:hypothetical protein